METPDGMMRKRDVAKLIGVTTRGIEKMIERGDFPRPIAYTERNKVWRESTVRAWMQSKEAAA
jgi:predicted DNA-binding transcriptional regulator AlpA